MHDESYYKIKYFFRLDMDYIQNRLTAEKERFSNSDSNCNFFQLFSFLLKCSSHYHNFLTNAYYSPSFFGNYANTSTGHDMEYIAGLQHLIFLSLMNECIIKDWLSLRKGSSETIKINSRQQSNTLYYPIYKDQDNLAQLYTNRYNKIYLNKKSQTDTENLSNTSERNLKHPDYYSHKLLNYISNSNNKTNGYFGTPSYLAPFTYFLFNDSSVHTLNKHIANKTSRFRFFTIYSNFVSACKIHNSNLAKQDYLTFMYFCEKYYRLHTFHFLLQLFKDFDTNSSLNTQTCRNTLRILDGNYFSSIGTNLMRSPYIFSNNFLFDCGLNMLANANSYPRYPTYNPGVEFIQKFSTTEKNNFIQDKGLSLLAKYVSILSEVIEPLLYDLWTLAMKVLYPDSETHYNVLWEYVQTHFTTVTADFSQLSVDEILSFVDNSHGELKINETQLNTLCEKKTFPSRDFDLYSLPIKRKVFDIFSESLNHQDHPSIFEKNYIDGDLSNNESSYTQRTNQYDHIKYILDLIKF